jgi:hypothetical protein
MENIRRAAGLFFVFFSLFFASMLFGQGMEGMSGSCPMCGGMGWGGMILGGLLVIALIAALVALTIFLIRRSRSPH